MKKKRVFLGVVGVVPRADFKRHLESPLAGSVVDGALHSHLEEVLNLPKPPPQSEIGALDYAIDVFVAKHQSGEVFDVSLGEIGFPLLWRPAVQVSSRLYSLHNQKVVATLRVKKRMGWGEYLNGVLSFRHFLGFHSPFTHVHMTRLLDEALIETLQRVSARL